MSLDRVRTQLGKFGLSRPNDEMSIAVQQLAPYFLFSDASGDSVIIALADDVSRRLNDLSYRMEPLTAEQFWEGGWLGNAPLYRGFDGLWEDLAARPSTVTVAVPRSSERLCIGRAKRLNRDFWLFETEDGQYGLVSERDTRRWQLE